MAPRAAVTSPSPLYSTTFTIYKLSPLYHGPAPLDNASLTQHASRFRDVLVGDVLRGVRVGLATEDETLTRVGALRHVQWRFLAADEAPAEAEADETELPQETTGSDRASTGIHVEIQYETAVYTAILLRSTGVNGESMPDQLGFSHYPLLLARMPVSLRETLLHFLATNFDARASPLRLGPQVLAAQFEKYISDLLAVAAADDDNGSAATLRLVIKDLVISFTFHRPQGTTAAHLKSIDMTVPKDDLGALLRRGQKLAQATNSAQPFMAALAHYIQAYTALDINHPHVNIAKVACGAFVLGADGRIKLFPPPGDGHGSAQARATRALATRLIDLARTKQIA